jgi:hypothetical protein
VRYVIYVYMYICKGADTPKVKEQYYGRVEKINVHKCPLLVYKSVLVLSNSLLVSGQAVLWVLSAQNFPVCVRFENF